MCAGLLLPGVNPIALNTCHIVSCHITVCYALCLEQCPDTGYVERQPIQKFLTSGTDKHRIFSKLETRIPPSKSPVQFHETQITLMQVSVASVTFIRRFHFHSGISLSDNTHRLKRGKKTDNTVLEFAS
jgi:hypothetical protein